MTEAKTILKMIEEVDPADAAKLDEIDGRFWTWMKKLPYKKGCDGETFCPLYTRSRDALKAIRPEEWQFKIEASNEYECSCEAKKMSAKISLPEKIFEHFANTEELAELHTIIQAIAYERART